MEKSFLQKLYNKILYHFKKCKMEKLNKMIQHIRVMGYIPKIHGNEVVAGESKTKFTPGQSLSFWQDLNNNGPSLAPNLDDKCYYQ